MGLSTIGRYLFGPALVVCLALVVPFSLSAATIPKEDGQAAAARATAEPVVSHYIVSLGKTPVAEVDQAARELATQYNGHLLEVWKHAVRGFWIEMAAVDADRLANDPRVQMVEQDSYVSSAGWQRTGVGSVSPVDHIFPNTDDPLWHLTRINRRLPYDQRMFSGLTDAEYLAYEYSSDGRVTQPDPTPTCPASKPPRVSVYVVDMGVFRYHQEFYPESADPAVIKADAQCRAHPGQCPDNPSCRDIINSDVIKEIDSSNIVASNLDPRTSTPKVPIAYVAPDCSLSSHPCGQDFLNDGYAHGTSVAGFIVGRQIGVAKGVTVVPVKVYSCANENGDITSVAALVSAFDWIAQNATPPAVVSISTFRSADSDFPRIPDDKRPCVRRGGDTQCMTGDDISIFEQAVNSVIDRGVPVVASANNFDNDACKTVPARFSRRGGSKYKVRNAQGVDVERRSRVIVAGGTNSDDSRWIETSPPVGSQDVGSNFGQCVDIWAPGSQLSVVAGSTPTAYFTDQPHGTSYSAPMVAGVIARWLAEDCELYKEPVIETADRVWRRLRDNATRITSPSLGLGSPDLLLYAGGITIKEQPQSQVIPPSGSATLGVTLVDATDVQYEWYTGTSGRPEAGPVATTAALEVTAAEDYWVRVKKEIQTPDGPRTLTADSNAAHVTVGTCSSPVVKQDVESQWLTLPPGETSMSTTLSIVVGAGDYRYQWTDLTQGITFPAGSASLPTRDVPISRELNGLAAGTHYYRVEVWPTGARESCSYVSDSVQVRVCGLPVITRQPGTGSTNPFIYDSIVFEQDRSALRVEASGALEYLWYKGPAESRRPFISTANGSWTLQRTSIPALPDTLPGETDYYSVRVSNGCGQVFTDPVRIIHCVTQLGGKVEGYGEFALKETISQEVPYNEKATLAVQMQYLWDKEAIVRDVTYRWEIAGVPVSTGSSSYTTATPITQPTDVVVFARDKNECERIKTFKLRPSPVPPPMPKVGFDMAASELSEAQPAAVARVRLETPDGQPLARTVTVQYGTHESTASDEQDFTPTSGTLTFDAGTTSGSTKPIQVPIIDDAYGEFDEQFDIVLSSPIGALLTTTKHTVTIKSNDPRRRACCGGATPNRVSPGGTVTLSPPETGAGYTYEWRIGGNYDSSIAPFSTLESPTWQIFETTQFWVRTRTPEGGMSDSDLIEVFVAPPSGVYVVAEPAGYVLPGNPVKLTASDPNGTRYEWRKGPKPEPGQEPSPLFSTSYPLVVSPGLDTQYWVRVFYGSEFRDSEPFTVRVCNSPAVGAVISPPAPPYVAHNGSIDLYAVGVGDDLRYTWYAGEAGDTSSWLGYGAFLRPYITQDVEKFWVRGVDRCGQYDDSSTVNVYRCLPTITQQPQGDLIAPGQTATLSVAAIGGDGQPLPESAYQWYRSDDLYQQHPLATGASYTPPAAAATTTYYATISVTCNGWPHVVRSAEATLETCANPAIVSSSGGSIMAYGQSATIGIYAEGTDLTYQWYEGTAPGGTLIPEATSASLTVAPQNPTSYWCRVTSQGLCTTDSPTLPVTVCRTPVIDTPPASKSIFKNTSTTLGIAAHEVTETPETYQWYQRSNNVWVEIPGATSTSYTTPILSSETEYRVRVSAGLCSVNSPTATISMCTYPQILTVSKDRNVSAGDTVTLTVNDISPVFDKNVRWFQGASGVHTTPLTSSSLNRTLIVAPTTTTQYWAEVDHLGCVSWTSTITVNVCVPKITVDPVGRTVAAGTSTTLTVGASGAPGLTYQWYKGQPGDITQPIAGATSSSLTVSPTSTTSYWARATGTCGSSADSAAATITVCAAPVITGTSGPTVYTRAGSPALLSVAASGNNLSYQWHNGPSGTISPIADATSIYHSVSPSATASYWARVYSDGVCFANSGTITVDVCSNPSITAQPQPKVIRTGQATTLSVTASSSTGSLTYQWYQGASGNTASPIAGAMSSNYTTPTLTADTSYWVRVTRGACSTDSAAAMVTVCKITASTGSNVNSASGQPVNVAVSVSNSRVAQPTVTWYAGNSGNTSAPVQQGPGLVQITVTPAVTTSYWARVNDGTCTADSNAMTVNVCKPTITTQPAGVMINNGQSTTLSAAASGAPLTYQWYAGDSGVTISPIAGATGPSLTVAPAATTSYWVRASGCAGSIADSAAATVSVCAPPTAPMPTASGPQAVGSFAIVSIAASGTDLTYQWYRGLSGDTSLPLSGGMESTLTFSAASSAYYWARVTGRCGTANSPAVLHNVNPQITKHPQSAAVVSGSKVTLSVQASGTYLGYQWYRGNSGDISNPIAGATSTTYTTPALTASTSYWCKVTSGTSGATASNTAAITMCSGPTVTQFYPQYLYTNCYDLFLTVGSAWQGKVIYTWYKGVPGDVAHSTYMQEAGMGGNRLASQCVTEPTTYWVRVWTSDRSCYRDTGGLTLSPVE